MSARRTSALGRLRSQRHSCGQRAELLQGVPPGAAAAHAAGIAASRFPTCCRRPPVLRSRRRSCSCSVGRASSRRGSRTRGHRIGWRIAERGARAHRHHGVLPSAEPVRHRLAHPRPLPRRKRPPPPRRRPSRTAGPRAGRRERWRLPTCRRRPYGVRETPGNTGYGPAFRPRPAAAEVSGRPGNAPAAEDRPERRATGLFATCGARAPWVTRQSWANSSPSGPARTGRPKGSVTPNPHPRVEGKPGSRVRRRLSECGRTTPHRSGRVRSSAPTCWFRLPAHLP